MAKGRVQAASTVAERKRLRATLGELKSLKVGPGVKKRCPKAVNFFLWYVTCCVGPLANSLQELDQYALQRYEALSGGLQVVAIIPQALALMSG